MPEDQWSWRIQINENEEKSETHKTKTGWRKKRAVNAEIIKHLYTN